MQLALIDEVPLVVSDEWYTPAHVIEQARQVLGAIDLDPASCAVAQQVVKAAQYYTKDDDGLVQTWQGRVWLNPPYSTPLINLFVAKLLAEYATGRVTAALILTNNATDTTWAQKLLRHPVCLLRGRVRFWQPDKLGNGGARQGQMLTYLGENPAAFYHSFTQLGRVLVPLAL